MCLILFGFRSHRHFPLVVAANRDEQYKRPAAPAAFWNDHPEIYGGRDLEKGGTWMGLHRNGRFAAITNFREGLPKAAAPRSRGELVSGFLAGSDSADEFFRTATERQSEYNAYSMIAGDLDELRFQSNRGNAVLTITPGVHGLSNHLLDTPWPKVTAGINAVESTRLLEDPDAISARLFDLLSSRSAAVDARLPDTGIDRQRERELSPAFIAGEHYGTRTSTVLLVHASGDVFVHEKRFGPDGLPMGEDARAFRLRQPATRAAVSG